MQKGPMQDGTDGTPIDEQLNAIRTYVKRSLADFKAAGAAVAVVKGDHVILSEGFGERDVERNLPVTPETLFAIGSSTKAFTTMSVGLLVDDGKLDWDKPVSEFLPEFKLIHKYETENATLRDLATHRVGLPRHEFVWYKAPLSRKEIIHRLQYLSFTKPFRTTFQYQNMMYLTLGYVVEHTSGQTWEQFVQARIFNPLGMTRTNFSVDVSQQDDNFAKPYKVVKGEIQQTPFANIDAIGPAGSINSTVMDMALWVQLQLGKGRFCDAQLISEPNLTQMHNPQISTGPSLNEQILFPSYGMGWFTEVYRGHQVIHHGGNIDGFTAMVAMVPKEQIGVVVLTNQQNSVLPRAAAYTIFDTLLGLSREDWNAILKTEMDKLIASMKESGEQKDPNRVPDTQPSHELSAYIGDFEHPAYGTLSVAKEEETLYLHYHALDHPLPLEHYHYDIFSVTLQEGEFTQSFKFQFHTDLRGKISRVTVPFEAMLDPIEFVRKVELMASKREVLEQYSGEYDLAGVTVRVALRGDDSLTITVPGQPTYELMAVSETEFNFKGLSGFELEFLLDSNGACTELRLTQPNGTFVLKRK